MPTILRRSAAVLAAAACLLAIAACGNGGDATTPARASGPVPELKPDQQVAITWETYNLMSKQTGSDTVKALVRAFERKHPNIKVTARAPNGADYVGAVHREVVAGNAPDVAQLTFDALDFIVDGLRARPLDELAGQAALKAHFDAEPAFHPRARALAALDGKTYGIPYVFSTPVLFYNAELFKRAGLDPAAPPKTWDDVERAGRRIRDRTGAGGINLACFVNGPTGDWCLQGIIRSNGGNVMSADRTRLTWGEPAAVEAIARLQRLVASGVATDAKADDALEQFSRGKLGMYLMTSVYQATLLKAAKAASFTLRAGQLPAYGDKPSVPTHSGSALFVLSRDAAKARAAWELIAFLTGPEAETMITRDIGYVPMRPGLLNDARYLKAWADTQRAVLTPNLQQFDRLEPWRAFPGRQYAQIAKALTDATEQVIYQRAEPQSTLQKAQHQAEALLPNA